MKKIIFAILILLALGFVPAAQAGGFVVTESEPLEDSAVKSEKTIGFAVTAVEPIEPYVPDRNEKLMKDIKKLLDKNSTRDKEWLGAKGLITSTITSLEKMGLSFTAFLEEVKGVKGDISSIKSKADSIDRELGSISERTVSIDGKASHIEEMVKTLVDRGSVKWVIILLIAIIILIIALGFFGNKALKSQSAATGVAPVVQVPEGLTNDIADIKTRIGAIEENFSDFPAKVAMVLDEKMLKRFGLIEATLVETVKDALYEFDPSPLTFSIVGHNVVYKAANPQNRTYSLLRVGEDDQYSGIDPKDFVRSEESNREWAERSTRVAIKKYLTKYQDDAYMQAASNEEKFEKALIDYLKNTDELKIEEIK